jgi:hypothetical protein
MKRIVRRTAWASAIVSGISLEVLKALERGIYDAASAEAVTMAEPNRYDVF